MVPSLRKGALTTLAKDYLLNCPVSSAGETLGLGKIRVEQIG